MAAPVVQPDVQGFHHAGTGTWSYVVRDPGGRAAAVVDPVLDFDAKSGRTGTDAARALVEAVRAQDLDVQWLLETHAHADHLSAAHWLKSAHFPQARIAIGEGIRAVQRTFLPVFGLDGEADGAPFDHLFADGERFALVWPGTAITRASRPPSAKRSPSANRWSNGAPSASPSRPNTGRKVRCTARMPSPIAMRACGCSAWVARLTARRSTTCSPTASASRWAAWKRA